MNTEGGQSTETTSYNRFRQPITNYTELHSLTRLLILITILITQFALGLSAQNKFENVGTLYEDGDARVELQIRASKTYCLNDSKPNKFQLNFINRKKLLEDKIYTFLVWKTDVTNCNGELVQKTICVDLSKHTTEGTNQSMDWEIEGEIVTAYYDANLYDGFDNTPDLIKEKPLSILPDSIQGDLSILPGESATFQLKGGKLAKNTSWVWRENSCNGREVGRGDRIQVTPLKTTTYFLRAEGSSSRTSCMFVTVEVDAKSKPASGITGTSKICSPARVEFAVVGGKLGINAKWVWYRGECIPTNKLGEGKNISVNINQTSTINVRAESATYVTDYASTTTQLLSRSETPVAINGQTQICSGESLNLQITGGKLAEDGKWMWYQQTPGLADKENVGEGQNIRTVIGKSMMIYVQGVGFCNTTSPISVNVKLLTKSTSPTRIMQTAVNKRGRYKLSVLDGKLGDAAKWLWYTDECGKTEVGEGSEIVFRAKKSKVVYVRGEGSCNVTECANTLINFDQVKTKFKFINVGVLGTSQNDLGGMLTLGSQTLYVRAKIGIQTFEGNGTKGNKYQTNDNAVVNFPTNSNTYYVYNGKTSTNYGSYTGGFLFGGKKLRAYLGAGYGKVEILWDIDIYNYSGYKMTTTAAKNIARSIEGAELEAGLFLKLGHFNIMAGGRSLYRVSSPSASYIDLHGGIGVSF